MGQFFKNSSFGVLQLLLSLCLVFFSIPIFISGYGLKMYGVYSIVSIFGNLTALFNLGLNTALLKFISGNNNREEGNIQVSASLIIILFVTAIFTTLLLLCQNFIIGGFFKIEPDILSEVKFAFRLFLIANVFVMLGQPFVALIQANNHFYRTSVVQLIFNMINGLGLIIFVKMEGSFKYVALPALLSASVWFSILLGTVIKKYKFKLVLMSDKRNLSFVIRKQLNYSLSVYATSLLNFMNEPLLKIIVAKFLGPETVGALDIVLKVKSQSITLFTKAFEPLSAIIASQKIKEEIKSIVHYSEQVALLCFIPLCSLIYLFSDALLRIWISDISNQMIFNIKISLIIFTLSMVVVPNFFYLTFHNHIKDCMKIQIVGIATSLIVFFSMKGIIGDNAPVAGVCGNIVVGFILNIFLQYRYLGSIIIDRESSAPFAKLVALTGVFLLARLVWGLDGMVYSLIFVVTSFYISLDYAYKLNRRGKLNFLNSGGIVKNLI